MFFTGLLFGFLKPCWSVSIVLQYTVASPKMNTENILNCLSITSTGVANFVHEGSVAISGPVSQSSEPAGSPNETYNDTFQYAYNKGGKKVFLC